jgi:thiamine pyrophosphate-dependent acetolactate synthase large subunit-like protein
LTKYSKEVIYLQNTVNELNKALRLDIPINIPVIMEDNQGAIKLGHNAEFHKRTKHIDIKYHYIRELVEGNKLRIIYINTKDQLADPLTKITAGPTLNTWREKLGLEKYQPGGVK